MVIATPVPVGLQSMTSEDSKHVKVNCKGTYAGSRWRDRTGTARHMTAYQCGIWYELTAV